MRRRSLCVIACCITALMQGCVEERIVSVRGPANLPGAEGGVRSEVPNSRTSRTWEEVLGKALPPIEGTPVEGKPYRFLSPDRDTIILQSHAPRQLMVHLFETLQSGEDELLYEQVLSSALKDAYQQRGLDPRESVTFLKENIEGVMRFLALLPLGEQTPGAMLLPIGRSTYRLDPPGGPSEGQTFRSMDMVFERGGFRLLMLN